MLQSPLHAYHVEHGAQLVEYAGWEMPIRYTSIKEEHEQTRTSGGLFDVSHMGRVKITGKDATRLLERLCSRAIGSMEAGQCRYSLVCNEAGGIRDDVIVMRFDENEYIVVVNAANREKLLDHFEQVRAAGEMAVSIDDQTVKTAMFAMQGPKVMDIIGRVSKEIPALKRYRFAVKNVVIMKIFVSRTGYTGEDGVEVILPRPRASAWCSSCWPRKGATRRIISSRAGWAAATRCAWRQACPSTATSWARRSTRWRRAWTLPSSSTRPEPFVGQEALQRVAEDGGPARRLVGLKLEGRRTARQHMPVKRDGREIGEITSGCLSPTLDRSIAMAYLDTDAIEPGTTIEVDAGRTTLEGEVVPLPFYKR